MSLEKLGKNLEAYDWLADARAPLVTIEDCYDVLDVWHHNRQPDFAEIQPCTQRKL